MAPHHPIPNAKFPPVTAFLKLAFSPPPCLAIFSCKNFQQEFPARISYKIFSQDFPARISPQDFPAKISCKIFPLDFPADFPKLYPDWLAPCHPIPNAKFPPITALNWLFTLHPVPQDFPARFSSKNFPQEFPTRISHKIFPQDFPAPCPTRFSCKIFPKEFPELDPDWLAPHHPVPKAKFPPITALLNRPTYHKSAKVSPPRFPQILWEPQIN